METRIYKLTATSIEKTLPKLLEKLYQSGKRVLVVCEDDGMLARLNSSVWTFSTMAFIPHGADGETDLLEQDHQIWLTCDQSKNFPADVLVMLTAKTPQMLKDTKSLIYFYDQNGDHAQNFTKLFDENVGVFADAKTFTQNLDGSWAN